MSQAFIALAVWGNLLVAFLLILAGYSLLAPFPALIAGAIYLANSWSRPLPGEGVADH